MVRISKQEERRSRCPKRCRAPAKKTGSLKDNLKDGFRHHPNAIEGGSIEGSFISKIK